MKTYPLVTFALFAYNQERFIREAVEAALAQDYSPLEIILSDDHSSDGTFSIMTEITANYHGPHSIHVNRNPKNLGIGGHVQTIFSRSKGDWIVGAAGDDVSLPSRVRRIVDHLVDGKVEVDCVAVQLTEINELGRKTGRLRNCYVDREEICVTSLTGAGLAYSRRVVDDFPPIGQSVHNEDVVLTARALMLSSVGFVQEPLVLYRSHSSNRPRRNIHMSDFSRDWLELKRRDSRREIAIAEQIELDLIGRDSFRIPYYREIMSRRRKAQVVGRLINRGFPVSIADGILVLRHLSMLKIWVGVAIVRWVNPFFEWCARKLIIGRR